MSKPLNITLVMAAVLLTLLILIALALLLFVDADAYKSRLETAASEALGMDVRINGDVGMGFFPGLLVTLEGVRIHNQGADIASAKSAKFGIDLLPLLQKEIHIGHIALDRPTIVIERGRDGRFNTERAEKSKTPSRHRYLAALSFSKGSLTYKNAGSGRGFGAQDCDLDASDLRLSADPERKFLQRLALTAKLACGSYQSGNFSATDVKLSVTGKDGVFDFKPVVMHAYGGEGKGDVRMDATGETPHYHVNYALSRFHIEQFFKTLSPKKIATGSMDFTSKLSLQGKTIKEMKQTMDGEATLHGKNLTLLGFNLDEKFAQYESSQNFSLYDVGAVFLAGPVGLMATKGYDFASVIQASSGGTRIHTLNSHWQIKNGVAEAKDVAMATQQNRVALHGSLDFANERFKNVIVALLNARGCARAEQKITGSFHQPVAEKPNILVSLSGPALQLFKQGKEALTGEKCDVFYKGSVEAAK